MKTLFWGVNVIGAVIAFAALVASVIAWVRVRKYQSLVETDKRVVFTLLVLGETFSIAKGMGHDVDSWVAEAGKRVMQREAEMMKRAMEKEENK